jgi:hypothetical protein
MFPVTHTLVADRNMVHKPRLQSAGVHVQQAVPGDLLHAQMEERGPSSLRARVLRKVLCSHPAMPLHVVARVQRDRSSHPEDRFLIIWRLRCQYPRPATQLGPRNSKQILYMSKESYDFRGSLKDTEAPSIHRKSFPASI